MDQTIAITGMGAVTAQGIGVDATWLGVRTGCDVLRPWRGAPHRLDGSHPLEKIKVAECPELPRPDDLPLRLWRELSRTQQLACIAVDEALTQARLPRKQTGGQAIGLFMATTVCGMDRNERYYEQYRTNTQTADVDLMRRLQPFEIGALLRRRHGIGAPGLNQMCLTTCVGSAMSIGAACDAIALGECAMAIAGGSEALCRVVLSGFHALKVVAADGCRPFDKDRPGITVGEGAGVLVLESVDHAAKRGLKPLAYVRGFGVTCDAHHLTAPDPEGRQAARAMMDALERAGFSADNIDYINAHGTGTRDNDIMETLRGSDGFFRSAQGRPAHQFDQAVHRSHLRCGGRDRSNSLRAGHPRKYFAGERRESRGGPDPRYSGRSRRKRAGARFARLCPPTSRSAETIRH